VISEASILCISDQTALSNRVKINFIAYIYTSTMSEFLSPSRASSFSKGSNRSMRNSNRYSSFDTGNALPYRGSTSKSKRLRGLKKRASKIFDLQNRKYAQRKYADLLEQRDNRCAALVKQELERQKALDDTNCRQRTEDAVRMAKEEWRKQSIEHRKKHNTRRNARMTRWRNAQDNANDTEAAFHAAIFDEAPLTTELRRNAQNTAKRLTSDEQLARNKHFMNVNKRISNSTERQNRERFGNVAAQKAELDQLLKQFRAANNAAKQSNANMRALLSSNTQARPLQRSDNVNDLREMRATLRQMRREN
jgi:hypothetical protein